jgi:hypothetical protein
LGLLIGCQQLPSIRARQSTSPPARQFITQAALQHPLFAAAQRAVEVDHTKRKS